MRCVHTEVNEEQGVREAMMEVGDSGSYIQLLSPLSPDTTIGKFLDKNGPGIQQMAYRVDDIDEVSEHLRGEGLRLLYDEPKTRHGGQPGQLHPPQERGRHPGRAGRARPRRHGPLTAVPARWVIYRSVTSWRLERKAATLKQILEAILAGESAAGPGRARELPGRRRPQGRAGACSRASPPATRTRARACTSTRCRPRSSARARRSSRSWPASVNFNTVWTSIFEPVSHLRLPRALRPALRADQAARPALPRGRLATCPASCSRSARA